MSTLDTIVNNSNTPVVEPTAPTARLTSGQVVVALSAIGKQLQAMTEAYSAIPDSDQKTIEQHLKTLKDYASAVVKNADRLLAGNR